MYARSLQTEGREYLLDVYAPAEEGNWPVVIFVPGNGNKEAFARETRLAGWTDVGDFPSGNTSIYFRLSWILIWAEPFLFAVECSPV